VSHEENYRVGIQVFKELLQNTGIHRDITGKKYRYSQRYYREEIQVFTQILQESNIAIHGDITGK